MRDVGELFTDREAALRAVDALVAEGGTGRFLVLTGVSGMGKSTVLARLVAHPPSRWACAVVDAEVLVSGMVVRAEGGEDAALELLRQVGGRLAAVAPWWRRRWLRQKAAVIGSVRPWRVNVRQWAGFGGHISHSPVQVSAGPLTQGERRRQWTGQLLKVARAVRRRQLLLLVDTSELLAYFDDVAVEQPRPGRPYGVASWFVTVLEELLDQMPGLRVVLAGTTAPASVAADGRDLGRIARVELEPWAPKDTGRYLARRGLSVDAQAAVAVTDAAGGLPVEISWLMDILTDGREPASAFGALVAGLAEQAGPARRAWLRSHVLERISDGTLRLLYAAAVLEIFTPDVLLTVARDGGSNEAAGRAAFARVEHSSYIRPLDADTGQWRVHTVLRNWLLEAARDHDARRPPPERVLPSLHRAAADYHEALAVDNRWSLHAAHHRFATGDDRHSAAWTARLTRALSTQPLDTLRIQALADAALAVPGPSDTLSAVFADAHLASSLLDFQRARYPAAQHHAEQALALYESLDGHSEAVRTAARLAGHTAWKRPRYQDAVTHWTTATTPHTHGSEVLEGTQRGTTADGDTYALRVALAEAVLATGDALRAHTLLAALPETSPTAQPDPTTNEALSEVDTGTLTVAAAVAEALSAYPLPGALPGDMLLLRTRTAYALNDHDEAAAYALHVLEQSKTSDHHTALAHDVLALVAYSSWDLEQARQHTRRGLTAARRCPDQGCMVQLLLTDANLAGRRAVWAPSGIGRQSPTPEVNAAAPSAAPTTSMSLTQRAESAHQRELADRQQAAAEGLAAQLNHSQLHAQAIALRDPAAALTVYRAIGDRHGEAAALEVLADAAGERADLDTAEELANQALALHRTLGDRRGEANMQETLAHAALQRTNPGRAEEFANQALALFCTLRDQRGKANILGLLADAARQRGDLDTAEELANQALALHRTLGNRLGEANILGLLAYAALQRTDLHRAEELASQALTIHRTLGYQRGEAAALGFLADAARQRGDLDTAEELLSQALALHRTLGNRLGEISALGLLADAALRRDDPGRARELADQALALNRTLGNQLGEASALGLLADAARQRGDLDTAEELASQALTIHRSLGNPSGEATALWLLADAACQRGDTRTGRRTLAEAAALYEQIGMVQQAASCRQQLQEW
ncbi:tetratricopeptide repeat protein [Streptomyces phaeolivaceus]|uniref:Tetratricopeptide repeat protein n=1 Tax=Streptomyces phaeolivaceus TaxID=2653200 RepID=A0A5P8K3I2_9ACTN|nr:tetratricopeptide repeat protein [Streptomyces phaeolivaceus]QFQ97342.1 tetratricopeptide repeat protein [Streptomyces phaeolivaceus]